MFCTFIKPCCAGFYQTKFSTIQQRCKEVVAHFHRSTKSAAKLREVQQQLSIPQHKLKQEVVTRWNSTYQMFERINEQFEAITTSLCLLNHNHLCLTVDEKALIASSLIVLKPFLEATEDISGDMYVSVSMIIPLVKLLNQSMRGHLSVPLAAKLSSELSACFAPIEGAYVTAVTTLLNPRFKKLPFSSASSIDHTITRITSEVSNLPLDSEHSEQASNTENANTSITTQSPSLWDAFDKHVSESSSHRTTQTDATIEVRRYFEEQNIERSKDPLEWWKNNSVRFPKLHRVAKKYLCIPGSSVPSERLFSAAGQLVSERRNRLKPKNIDILLFLHHNLKRL